MSVPPEFHDLTDYEYDVAGFVVTTSRRDLPATLSQPGAGRFTLGL